MSVCCWISCSRSFFFFFFLLYVSRLSFALYSSYFSLLFLIAILFLPSSSSSFNWFRLRCRRFYVDAVLSFPSPSLSSPWSRIRHFQLFCLCLHLGHVFAIFSCFVSVFILVTYLPFSAVLSLSPPLDDI